MIVGVDMAPLLDCVLELSLSTPLCDADCQATRPGPSH